MKKYGAVLAVVTGCLVGNAAQADNQTVSIGYAQSKVQDFKNIRGVNLQYQYEWDSPLSVLGSFTYMKASEGHTAGSSIFGTPAQYKKDTDAKYYSLLIGPSYRLNDYISLYGLIGAAHTKENTDERVGNNTYSRKESYSSNSTSLAYGLGFSVNPTDYLVMRIGYEGTESKHNGKTHDVNGFNIGVGYRF
ncbi:outer membrane beta-barrel protein [Providencia rettgeri]